MVDLNANVGSIQRSSPAHASTTNDKQSGKSEMTDTFKKYLEDVDDLQAKSDASVQELLAGKNQDVNSVVAAVAQADMSFRLLVGVRNKIVEAYKRTMQMQV